MVIELDIWILVYLSLYASFVTLLLYLARRDLKLGLKKFFMAKFGKQPVIIRYYGANLNVEEHVVATRGVADVIELFSTKWFGLKKTKTGSTFFLDERFTRRRDDGFNELSYSYKSVSPVVPDSDVAEAENSKIKLYSEKSFQDLNKDEDSSFFPVELDANALYTDPRRINRFVELVKTSAKAEALEAAGADVLKWAKWATFAALGALAAGVLVWYTMDSNLFPMIEALGRQVSGIGSGLIEV